MTFGKVSMLCTDRKDAEIAGKADHGICAKGGADDRHRGTDYCGEEAHFSDASVDENPNRES